MASHRLNPRYAIKECSTCGRLYTKECCSIGNLKDKILVPKPDSSPRCARCGTPVDGPSCRGCAFLQKKFDEDLLAYYFNVWGSEVRKKEKAYEDEKYVAACRYMLSVTCDDEDDYIPLEITPDLPIEEPNYSLKMGDEHLDTILATESDEVIKSSAENLVPIPREFEEISDDTSDEFAGELAHIAPIPPGTVQDDFDSNDDTSSDDDYFEDIEYVSLEEVNEVDQEEKEFDLEDILQIQDDILREKLLNVSRLISNIESLKDNPIMDSDSSETSLSFSDNSLPEFESFSDHTEETRSGNTTTHANYSFPEYESFHFDNPSLPRPPPEPPDVCLDILYNDESFEPGEGENIVVSNVEEDDSFTFTIRTFLPFLTYPEVSLLYCSTRSEDLIFNPGIVTFHKPVDRPNKFFEASRVRLICPVQLELLILCVKLVWGDPYPFIIID
ncbi:hypothetical protein Tco_1228517 [Tanacetum coccineum]